MKRLASLILVATVALSAAPAFAQEGKCMWDSLGKTQPAEQKKIMSAANKEAFSEAASSALKSNFTKMYAACKIPTAGQDAANWAVFGYVASEWTALQLKDRWDAKALRAAFDNIPEADRPLVAGRLTGTPQKPAETAKADAIIAVMYKPFGRQAPQTPPDDLDNYFIARSIQNGGEWELHHPPAPKS